MNGHTHTHTHLAVESQILVVRGHLEHRGADLRSLRDRGFVDGGGEERHVVVHVCGETP